MAYIMTQIGLACMALAYIGMAWYTCVIVVWAACNSGVACILVVSHGRGKCESTCPGAPHAGGTRSVSSASIVMSYIAMAYIVMVHIVMARIEYRPGAPSVGGTRSVS